MTSCGLAPRALGPEILGEAFLREPITALAAVRIGLRRAIIAVERDDACGRRKLLGKVEDVAHRRGAERVDRLGVVADDRQAAAAGLESQQDGGLQAVGVLILIDQHVVEAAADVIGQAGVADHLRPVEQEVVVIEHVLLLLGFDIGREQSLSSAAHPAHHGYEVPMTCSIGISALTHRE